MRFTFLILTLLLLPACVSYHAEPLSPDQLQKQFAARTLTDPRLLQYLQLSAPPQTWTLDTLTQAAIYYHPDIAVARAHILAVQSAEITAGESPNPTMAIAPEYSINPPGANPWVLGWTFDVPIETAGKRKRRITQAKALTDVAKIELALAAWQVRSRLRDALAEFLLDQQQVNLLQQEVDTRTRYIALWDARIKAGEAARPDADTARIDLLTVRQAFFAAQGQLADARTKLAAAIGLPTSALENIQFTWPSLDQFAPIDTALLQRTGLTDRLDVRHALADYAAADAALQLEIAKQYPDLHIGPGYTFDQGQNKFQLGLSLELPLFNQNAGGVAEAQSHRRELAAKFLALQAAAIGDIESAAARYHSALNELTEAVSQQSSIDNQFSAGQKTFTAGQEDRLFLTGIEVQQRVTNRLQLDALRKAQFARAALEDAVQRPLDSKEVRP